MYCEERMPSPAKTLGLHAGFIVILRLGLSASHMLRPTLYHLGYFSSQCGSLPFPSTPGIHSIAHPQCELDTQNLIYHWIWWFRPIIQAAGEVEVGYRFRAREYDRLGGEPA